VQAARAVFAGSVRRILRKGAVIGDRADGHDVTALPAAHVRKKLTRERELRREVDAQCPFEILDRRVLDGREEEMTGIVHENVWRAAQPLANFLQHRSDDVGIREVAGDGGDPASNLLPEVRHRRHVARDENELGASLAERARALHADPARRSGDDG
jgi:hypothetical protein